jgi:hypothetical protein
VTSCTTTIEKEKDMRSDGISLTASDTSRQRVRALDDVALDKTVGEIVEEFLRELNLPTEDASGRPLRYHAHLEREGRHLNASELVGDALAPGDRLTLNPLIQAG